MTASITRYSSIPPVTDFTEEDKHLVDWLRSGSGAVRPFFGEPEPEPEVRFGNFANLNLGFTSKKGNFEFPADFPSEIFDFLRFQSYWQPSKHFSACID